MRVAQSRHHTARSAHLLRPRRSINSWHSLGEIAPHLKIPSVITSDVHYLLQEHAKPHDALSVDVRARVATSRPPISGPGSVTAENGTTIFTADNTYTAGTTIEPGATLQLGDGGTKGSVVGNVLNAINCTALAPEVMQTCIRVAHRLQTLVRR